MILPRFQKKAAELFDYYFDFITEKSNRKTNEFIAAVVRVNEMLKRETVGSIKSSLYSSPDFLLVKMLRNHNEHNDSVDIEFKMLDNFAMAEINPELSFLCLIPITTYRAAKNGRTVRYDDIVKIDSACSIIGNYVDIHCTLFNLVVYLYELLLKLDISLDTDAFRLMKDSYDKEIIHGIDHYVKPLNLSNIKLSDSSSLESHIVPFDKTALPKNTPLPNYNLLQGIENALDLAKLDFDDISLNFESYIKCVNGKPIEYYSEYITIFNGLHNAGCLSPLINTIGYSHKTITEKIINIGAMLESSVNDPIRYKLLNYNISAINELSKPKYIASNNRVFELLIFLAMIVNAHMYGHNKKEIKCMINIINSKSSGEVSNALRNIRNNKKSKALFIHLILSQFAMLLIEFPFKDHQNKIT